MPYFDSMFVMMFSWLPISLKASIISFQLASPLFNQYWRTSDSFLASVGLSLPMFLRICLGTCSCTPNSFQSTSFISSYTRSFNFGTSSTQNSKNIKSQIWAIFRLTCLPLQPSYVDRRTAESAKKKHSCPLNPHLTSPTPVQITHAHSTSRLSYLQDMAVDIVFDIGNKFDPNVCYCGAEWKVNLSLIRILDNSSSLS